MVKDYAAPTGLCSSPIGWDLSRLGSGERNLPKAKARRAERAGASESLDGRRQVRDLVFLVLVLQICRADGAGDEHRAKIILHWTFGAIGVLAVAERRNDNSPAF